MKRPAISVVIPSFQREGVLVDTARLVLAQLGEGDEILVVDQTARHQAETEAALAELARSGRLRWVRKARPSICEAMNVGVLLARREIVVFLDDDVVPAPGLLDVYREAFAESPELHAVNGQVLQLWNDGAVDRVRDFELGFDFAYSEPAEVVPALTCNFAVRREVFLAAGGMDETFEGGAHRCDADLGYRLRAFAGRPLRFEPRASVRHLQAGGGTRAHGAKDSWASIGSAVGDHYLGLRWFGWRGALRHSVARLFRAPVNRRTLRRPWLVPWLAAREVVAFARALGRVRSGPARTVRDLGRYRDVTDVGRTHETPRSTNGASGPGRSVRDVSVEGGTAQARPSTRLPPAGWKTRSRNGADS